VRGEPASRPTIPEDLEDKVSYKLRRKRAYLTIERPLLKVEFERLRECNPDGPFRGAVGALQRKCGAAFRRVIVTTRDSEPLALTQDFFEIALQPFSDRQLSAFFRKWLKASDRSPGELLAFVESNDRVRDICRRPLVATLVVSLYENGYPLPQSRADLYQKRFDLLLERWDRTRGVPRRNEVKAADKLQLLMRLALSMHCRHRRRFSKKELAAVWRVGFAKLYPRLPLDDLIWELRVCNNVISQVGEGEYSLGHLSFQEFLAAKAIMHTQSQALLIANFHDTWWREVIIFYSGLCGDISSLLGDLQKKCRLVEAEGLVAEMNAEARFTSSAVSDFITDAIADGQLDEHWEDDEEEEEEEERESDGNGLDDESEEDSGTETSGEEAESDLNGEEVD
jgi:hypothetical protein